MAASTLGHCANSAGIRGHSAGDIFPAVIVIKGSFELGFRYHVLNHPALNPLTGWGTYKTATTIARMRARNVDLLLNPTNT